MSRIIKNKIEFTMAGVPTISDKYDVISAIIPKGKSVVPGQVVDLAVLLSGVGDWTTVSSTTTRYGVVMHQNVQLGRTLVDGNVVLSDSPTTYNEGIAAGVVIKGFISVVCEKSAADATHVSTAGFLTGTAGLELKNLVVTRIANADIKLYEVEVK